MNTQSNTSSSADTKDAHESRRTIDVAHNDRDHIIKLRNYNEELANRQSSAYCLKSKQKHNIEVHVGQYKCPLHTHNIKQFESQSIKSCNGSTANVYLASTLVLRNSSERKKIGSVDRVLSKSTNDVTTSTSSYFLTSTRHKRKLSCPLQTVVSIEDEDIDEVGASVL